eukprot:scaffold12026_cov18-Tisochrysis_lutea.AAC.1
MAAGTTCVFPRQREGSKMFVEAVLACILCPPSEQSATNASEMCKSSDLLGTYRCKFGAPREHARAMSLQSKLKLSLDHILKLQRVTLCVCCLTRRLVHELTRERVNEELQVLRVAAAEQADMDAASRAAAEAQAERERAAAMEAFQAEQAAKREMVAAYKWVAILSQLNS